MTQNPGKGDDVTFLNLIFGISDILIFGPDFDLEHYLALTFYLHSIFVIPSVAFWQGLG